MQPHLNSDIRKIPSERKKGIAGTIIMGSILLFMLVVVAFRLPEPPETEEGILVNFGTDETGLGMIEPSPPPVQEEASVPQPAPAAETQKEKALLTQNNEEAPEVKKVDPEVERKRLEKIEADRKLKEQLEAERKKKEAEEAERKRIEAEQKRQADIMNKTRDALANSKNAGTTSKSEGEAGGTGNQGVQTGSVDTKNRGDGGGTGNTGNVSFVLGNRGFKSLPYPNYISQEEGKVVVDITVDRAGIVIQAIPGGKGSTTLNDNLLKAAKEAALKAKFDPKSDAPAVQKGTITYNFVLR